MRKFSFLKVVLPFTLAAVGDGELVLDSIEWHENDVRMPVTLSDHTATYFQPEGGSEEDGVIILIGGCDSVDGNKRHHLILDLFSCDSLTASAFSFDPIKNEFTQLADAPRPRYRHTAVADNARGAIWVIGGRDIEDNVIEEIDVFYPSLNLWSTVGKLPVELATSDLTGFFKSPSSLYVMAGFLADYTAVDSVFVLDTTKNPALESGAGVGNDVFDVTMKSNFLEARGDIHAVVFGGYAYIAGGITHANGWCQPLQSMERYNIEEDSWESMDDLQVGRADLAVAVLKGRIFAVGGEKKPEECLSDPAFASIPIDDVEMLDPSEGVEAQWKVFSGHPTIRFRFAAAPFPLLDSIYTFGGQQMYDSECDCFPTSDTVAFHKEVWVDASDDSSASKTAASTEEPSSSTGGLSGGAKFGIAAAAILGVASVGYLVWKKSRDDREG